MNVLSPQDRRTPHREDQAEAARCAFNRKAADDRAALMAQLDEFLAALRKEEKEQHA